MSAAVIRRVTAPLRTSFARHAGMLSSGQFIAAAVSMSAMIVLSRLYGPAEYGVLTSYMAVASVLSTLANWQYSQAIIVESSDRRAFALVWVCIYASILTAAGAAVIGLGLWLIPAPEQQVREAAGWYLLLPLTVLAAGPAAAWTALANRLSRYGIIASSQALSTTVASALSIGLGFAGWGPAGLMVGYFASQIYFLLVYGRFWLSLDRPRRPRRRYALALAKKHRHFAIWTTPSAFVGQFGMQVPIYILGLANNLTLIGAFGRGRQLLQMPLSLIGGAIGQVFYQRASADLARDGHCRPLYLKVSFGLLVVGLPPAALGMVIAPWLFSFVLGPDWRVAGEIARVLAPMLLLQLVCSPVSTVMLIVGRQAEDFWLQTGFAALIALLSAVPLLLGWGAYDIIVGYAVGRSLMYVVYFVRCLQLACGSAKPNGRGLTVKRVDR